MLLCWVERLACYSIYTGYLISDSRHCLGHAQAHCLCSVRLHLNPCFTTNNPDYVWPRLIQYCCAMLRTLLTSQYTVKPAGNDTNMKVNINGINIIIFL